jgi:hypothetical protein
MARTNWGDYFAKAFMQSMDTVSQISLEKRKAEQAMTQFQQTYGLQKQELATKRKQIMMEAPLQAAQANYYNQQAGWLKSISQYMAGGGEISVDINGNSVPEGTPGAAKIKGISKNGITLTDATKQHQDSLERFTNGLKSLGWVMPWSDIGTKTNKKLMLQGMTNEAKALGAATGGGYKTSSGIPFTYKLKGK